MSRAVSLHSIVRRAAVTGCARRVCAHRFRGRPGVSQRGQDKADDQHVQVLGWQPGGLQFGCPNTTTYGQVITVPAGKSPLNKFTFAWATTRARLHGGARRGVRMGRLEGHGCLAVRVRDSDVAFGDGLFHYEAFKPGGVAVTPGRAVCDIREHRQGLRAVHGRLHAGLGGRGRQLLRGGTFVYQNNSGDESQWTSSAWNTFGIDLAFKAFLS